MKFIRIKKLDNTFVCWNCGKGYYYSPTYADKNLFCEHCLLGLSPFMKCVGKLLKVPIVSSNEKNSTKLGGKE